MITYDQLSVSDATALQKKMAGHVRLEPYKGIPKTIAGADVSFNRFSSTIYAGIVVFSYPELKLLSYSLAQTETQFPYVSGYLAFREVPALSKAWDLLPEKPDLLILDGQGILHPRRMGIATHFGILNDQPTIGCAKTMLYGDYNNPDLDKFSTSPIYGKGELLGHALRTKVAVKPVFVSPGHLTDTETSVKIVKNCIGKYRIPEPTRIAHEMVNRFRTGELSEGFFR